MSTNSEVITIDYVQKNFPTRKNAITDEIVEILNKAQEEPEFQGESLLQTAITYEAVMTRNKVGMKDYLNAIRFCSYLISLDDNYTEAYKKTFFDRKFVRDRMDAPTTSPKYNELTSAASRYRRSRLVVDILTMSQVPLDLLFTGYRYKAIGVLADEMVNAAYSKDRINAAKELLAATKGPDNMKIELDVGVRESSAVQSLNDQLAMIAAKQKVFLETGATSLNELGAMRPREEIVEAEVL